MRTATADSGSPRTGIAGIPTLDDIRAAAERIAGVVLRTPFLPGAAAVRAHRRRDLRQIREPAGDLVVQGARRAGEASRRCRRPRSGARRGRHVGGQPRPGRRLSRAAPRHSGDHRHAEADALREDRRDPRLRRRGDPRRRNARRGAGDGARTSSSGPARRWSIPTTTPTSSRGQGTIGLEILADEPDLDAVVVPVGGGGLIAGVAIAVKALSPKTEVIGVETELYPSMWAALRGERRKMRRRVARRGHRREECRHAHPRNRPRAMSTTSCSFASRRSSEAVAAYLTLQKTMAEGAGAAALAARHRRSRPLPRQPGRPDPRRRQHRPAARGLDHGARARPRGAGRRASASIISDRPGRSRRHRPTIGEHGRQHPRSPAPPHDAERSAERGERRRDASRRTGREHAGGDRAGARGQGLPWSSGSIRRSRAASSGLVSRGRDPSL